jgi:RNA polymerase sigma factor (sigma-70 family)
MEAVIRHLRRAALLDRGAGPSDGQLLEAFLARREGAAFEALLRRHGPMVLGVCRRVLGDRHDAEDAFQATFLVLVRKAAGLRSRELVGNWLYGVAYRTAMKARAMNAKRRSREKEAAGRARPARFPDGANEELLERLDGELSRLPDKYRVPVVLCELEGRGRKEVARALGLPEGTLSWRLAQAKKVLARRLARPGAALPGVAVTAALAQGAWSAEVSASLFRSTARAGAQAAAGRASAEVVSAKVMALTEGVMKAMFLTKLKVAAWALGLAVLFGAGAVGLTYRAGAAEPLRPAQQPALGAQSKAWPAPDDLESLRLEIEALRKELRATRDRVKALEAEVRGRKADGDALRRQAEEALLRLGKRVKEGEVLNERLEVRFPDPERGPVPRTADPIADAEAALKRLRKDPKDKHAAEALEGALKRLQQRARSNKPVPEG